MKIPELQDEIYARPLFIHAHPDDEAIQSGGLICALADAGAQITILTCTRGEEGETTPGSVPLNATEAEKVHVRERELSAAREVLGVHGGYWLGTAPAREGEKNTPRIYRDSGMRWVSPGIAGPKENVHPDSFSQSELDQQIADTLALIEGVCPSVIIGYDSLGSYGHPDHVRAHELARVAAEKAGLPLVEIASDAGQEGFTYLDCGKYSEKTRKALECYRSQLTVVPAPNFPGWQIQHVGGQLQVAPLWPGLRRIW